MLCQNGKGPKPHPSHGRANGGWPCRSAVKKTVCTPKHPRSLSGADTR
jgi:hypothetical protein